MLEPTPPDMQALGALRPGDPAEKLAAAVGSRWRAPLPHEGGWVRYLDRSFHVTARLDRAGRLGRIEFRGNFDPEVSIAGLRVRMPEAELAAVAPDLHLSKLPEGGAPYRFGSRDLPNGARQFVETGYGKVQRIQLSHPKAAYPSWRDLSLTPPSTAFNVRVVPGLKPRGSDAPEGWCCGLPRGITPAQWPLSTETGLPLEHHFTVRVPEPYRVHGAQYVALALFSDTTTENRSAPQVLDVMTMGMDGRALPEAPDPAIAPFVASLRNRHPMEFRSYDILYSTHAAIWLTEAEFNGPECEPPEPIRTAANEDAQWQDWRQTTAAQRLFGWNGQEPFDNGYYLHRLAGRRPEGPWDILALSITPAEDPNAGREPVDFGEGHNPDGYVPAFSEEWDRLGLELKYDDLQFGGTVITGDGFDELSPFFLVIRETAGMWNLAGHAVPFDLVSMRTLF